MKNKECNLSLFRSDARKMKEGRRTTRRVLTCGIHRSKQRLGQNRSRLFLGFLCGLLFIGFRSSAPAQYAIDWYKIAGGGGTSTGGVYSVSGTIGQPDAEPTMTNGQYAVTGGFWVLPTAIQTEGAPTLTIVSFGAGQAQISWVPASTNWVLQETLSLSLANWVDSASGATNPVVVPTTLPTKFYRLFKP